MRVLPLGIVSSGKSCPVACDFEAGARSKAGAASRPTASAPLQASTGLQVDELKRE